MKRQWVAALLLLCGAGGARAEQVYSQADLDALVKTEGYVELVEHLADVTPSKRDARWDAAAEAGTVGYLGTFTDSVAALTATEDLLRRFPTLKKSKAFMQKRAEVGLPGFDGCYRNGGMLDCNKRLANFVGDDAELAFKAGKLVILQQNAYSAAPFFRRAVTGKVPNPAACKEETLRRATLAALGLPTTDAKVADALATLDVCFADLKEPVANEMATGDSYLLQNACPTMIKKQAVGGLMKSRCEAAAAKK